jgi:hypothetical protein
MPANEELDVLMLCICASYEAFGRGLGFKWLRRVLT